MPRNHYADSLIDFLNESPSPYHALAATSSRLQSAGVKPSAEKQSWQPRPGTSALLIRGESTLAAVRIPMGFRSEEPFPFHIVAAHTDSPCLRLKPRPTESIFGYQQWGVEVYGGVLFNSWLDRDLGLAGRVIPLGTKSQPGKLIRMDQFPIRIPQLAIHLDRAVNEQGLVLNPQRHLVPILGQTGASLESLLAVESGVAFSDMAFDLCLFDRTPARYGGLGDEFVFSGRLDNLAMCHAALTAFLEAPDGNAIQVMVLFDHEEVGSVSHLGAQSNFLASVLERVALALGVNREQWLALLPQSFLISADMAHGIHPNYPEKHEPDHYPLLNRGIVLKANAGMRYSSTGESSSRLQAFARQAGVEVQHFLSRSDLGCGSTVGPALSAALGIPAVDIGNAMLSMHSVREMCGSGDHGEMIALMKEFFRG